MWKLKRLKNSRARHVVYNRYEELPPRELSALGVLPNYYMRFVTINLPVEKLDEEKQYVEELAKKYLSKLKNKKAYIVTKREPYPNVVNGFIEVFIGWPA